MQDANNTKTVMKSYRCWLGRGLFSFFGRSPSPEITKINVEGIQVLMKKITVFVHCQLKEVP